MRFMNIKNYALIGLAGISSLSTTVKAQKFLPESFSVFTEIGVSACAHQEMALYRGVNIGFQSGNNRINTFLGASLNSNKKADFNGIVTDNFKWHKHSNFSSWARCMFSFSRKVKNISFELSPARISKPYKNFTFSANPAFTVYKDFKNNKTGAGLNVILESVYSITPKDKLFFELDYHAKKSKIENSLNKTSYKITYQKYF